MIIETKNSIYEIIGSTIKKLKGRPWRYGDGAIEFRELYSEPKVGGLLVVVFDDDTLMRTTKIMRISESERNGEN